MAETNSEISWNVQKLGLFGKIDGLFEKNSFKIAKLGKFAVFNGFISQTCLPRYLFGFLAQKSGHLERWKFRNYDEKRLLFREKAFNF